MSSISENGGPGLEKREPSQCVRGLLMKGHPGAMEYYFSPPISYQTARVVTDSVAKQYGSFPMKDCGFRPFEGGFVLDVPLHMDAPSVDRLFSAINQTGLVEIHMPLNPFPRPLVDHRIPMVVNLQPGERLGPGFIIEARRGEVRKKLGWFKFDQDGKKQDELIEPLGMKSPEDVRLITPNDDPSMPVLWEFTDGSRRWVSRKDIPKDY